MSRGNGKCVPWEPDPCDRIGDGECLVRLSVSGDVCSGCWVNVVVVNFVVFFEVVNYVVNFGGE